MQRRRVRAVRPGLKTRTEVLTGCAASDVALCPRRAQLVRVRAASLQTPTYWDRTAVGAN
jgi:hypothetical protein